MIEFIMIVEDKADADISSDLAKRILLEKVDWLEPEYFYFNGLEKESFTKWTDIKSGKTIQEIERIYKIKIPKYKRSREKLPGISLKCDGANTVKIMHCISCLKYKIKRDIQALILIRDLDKEPNRRNYLEQFRSENIRNTYRIEIVIGTPEPTREAWVLNGFIALNQDEQRILDEMKTELKFDPCLQAHRLRSIRTEQDPKKRISDPKYVVARFTGEDWERERQCWAETDLQILRERGVETKLTDYMNQIEARLVPIFCSETPGK